MSTSRSSTAALLPIFLIVLADVFGFTLVFPLLAIYAESLRATPLQAALLVSVFAACQLVSGPLLGAASDRVGRKPMLLISQVGTLLGFLLMARADSLWLLYVARVIARRSAKPSRSAPRPRPLASASRSLTGASMCSTSAARS